MLQLANSISIEKSLCVFWAKNSQHFSYIREWLDDNLEQKQYSKMFRRVFTAFFQSNLAQSHALTFYFLFTSGNSLPILLQCN